MTDEDAVQDDRHRCSCGYPLSETWYLCNRCSRKLVEDLDEIADRHQRLSAAPSPQPGRYDRAGSSAPGSRPPARLGVVALKDLRSGQTEPVLWRGGDGKQHQEPERDTPAVMRAVLGWCESVAAERGFTEEAWLPRPVRAEAPGLPQFSMADHDEMTGAVDWVEAQRSLRAARADEARRRRQRWAPTRVVDEGVAWLGKQDDWLARWSEAPALAANVRLLRNRLRSACGDPNARPIGQCVRYVSAVGGEEKECGAPIFLPPPAPGATPVVRCASRHRHEYDGVDLLRLKLINEQQQDQPPEVAS